MAKGTKAVAYLRTSSAANVGADKDSEKRQRAAITAYTKAAGIEIAVEVIRGVRALPGVAGVHLMAPGWANEAVPRVVKAAALDVTAAG